MEVKRNYLRPGRMLAALAEPALFSLTTARRKHLTLCQITTYEKTTPQFGTIQAIWLTIQLHFERYSSTIRDNSSIIRDNWRYGMIDAALNLKFKNNGGILA